MPEGSHSALHQGPMGEESPQLSSPLSSSYHVQGNVDLGPDGYGQICVEPLDGECERPVSLVSTLSSGSSRDSRSLFGSTAALPSSTTPPVPSEEDIDLELSPAESGREQARNQSPTLTGSTEHWRERLEPRVINNQRNNNASRAAACEVARIPTSPVISEAMAPNPKLTYVDRVVMEIIETERMYVKDLRSIVEDYLAHIIDTGNLPIRPEQVCALFGNIEDIYEFNSELLQALDMCENDPVAIAQCFVNKSEYFEIYTQYCNNYPNSVAALTNCMRSKTLAKFFRDRQAALKRSLPLGSYLLKPVQRILKYHLLLQEIAKHFDPDEEGSEVIQEAIDTMTGVAWYINDMKRKHEHAVRVQEIQSLLINWKGSDLTTYGELVLEGTFHVLRAKNTRTLFLFEKMLLITKKRGEHYVYKIHISCSTLMLLDSAKDPLLFSVIHFKRPKQPHTVQAKSVEEKRLWSHHIKRLILENHNTILPQKAKDSTLDNSNYVGKYQYSPERMMKAECCQAEDFHHGGRNGRRKSEPVKQIIRSSKGGLKHAESEGALLGDRRSLQPATSVSKLTSSLGEPQAERPCVEDPIPRRESLEQLSPTDSDLKLGSSPSEGRLEQEKAEEEGKSYKEDVLMGDDQDVEDRDNAEQQTAPVKETEPSMEEENGDVAMKDTLSTQVTVQELGLLESVPEAERSSQREVDPSQNPESPLAPSDQEAEPPETMDTSRETGEEEEGGSDSSGLHVEETSVLTNGDFSEEEEEVSTDNKSILPSSVLDQASVIAEHFISSLSRRSSLVSEDLGSLACPSPPTDNEVHQSPSARMDLEKQTQVGAISSSASPVTTVGSVSIPDHVPDLGDGERRSTLSKQDRLLIRKIRQYYEHAEHQDANFSIKRRESLSYIPAGLVRQLSLQLDSIPPAKVSPAPKKGLSRNRPTSWSVFDLPALEKSQNTEPRSSFEAKATSQSSAVEEEFRPSSEMLKVWEVMETEEESQDVQPAAVERVNDSESEGIGVNTDISDCKKDTQVFEESKMSFASEKSSPSSPAMTFPATQGGAGQDSKPCGTQENYSFDPSHLPKVISFRNTEEDQILQDMGKMKSKVFQLARQYSQRIRNNRPIIWQRSRQMAVHEENMRKTGKANPRLPLNVDDQAVIHEVLSPSPVQTPSSGASSQDTITSPQSPHPEIFHWPDVQELRSKYTDASHSSKTACVCVDSNEMAECCTKRCIGLCHKSSSSSDLHKSPTDCCRKHPETAHKETGPVAEDRPQQQKHSLLCRWSSLDQMLGSLPHHEVQNLQDSVRACSPVNRLQEENSLLQEGLNGSKSAVLSSGKASDSNIVKSLREKFQSLGTS